MNIKKMIVAALLLPVWTLAQAQVVNDADSRIVENIRQANVKYTNITSGFKQVKHVSVLGSDALSTGRVYYVKPDKLALQYENATNDLMLINGEQFVMVNGGKRREASSRSNARMREMKTILAACLQGDVLQMGAERITCEETPGYYKVTAELSTRGSRSNIQKVTLHFDKADLTLAILRTEEQDGSYTVYELTGKKFDQTIDENIFQVSKNRR